MSLISVEDIRDDVRIEAENCAAIRNRPSLNNFSRMPRDDDKGSPGLRMRKSDRSGGGMSRWDSVWKMLCRRRNERSFPRVSGRSSGASGSNCWKDAPVKLSLGAIVLCLTGEEGKLEEESGLDHVRRRTKR